ncbi:hypothetical protein NDA17_001756 [Ustilago hordei]|nr:hypothetical protein NDA17_001756 [Ustilago hordei]
MKLSGMFRIGFVAAIVTALILLPSCITAVGDEASTSTRPQYRLKEYQKNLNVETINSLNDLSRFPQGTHDIYEKVPFYHGKLFLDHSSHDEQSQVRAPLYSIDTPIGTVQQAIKDFKFVGIVDVSNNNARLFQLVVDKSGNRIEQIEFPDKQKVVRLFELDPILHHVRNLFRSQLSMQPPPENIEHLPHFNGKPILSQDSENIGQLFTATRIPPHEVYYFENEKLPIVFKPNTDEMFEEVKEQELYMARGHYLAAKQKYGQEIASIIWGKPIQLNDNSNDRLKSRIPLRDYPRFKSDAPINEMVAALQQHGRFRVYKMTDHGRRVAYKVLVDNPGMTSQPMQVSIKPLTKFERGQERIMALSRLIRLPG